MVDALARRWAELPDAVRTPAQTLGRHAVGCEGTHGVFPRCNLACTPCYHSRDANRVAVSGEHTVTEVTRQMSTLRAARGPRAHAQLIGGEVSLLPPDAHAASLQAMRNSGREPMSMSHGDFDYEYLESVALGPDGTPRFSRLSFAAHFDMLMFGRRGIERPTDERSLHEYRKRFTEMFARLRREHGMRSFLAHNMTVTPRNISQLADVIRECHTYGFSLFSFQPAAFVGDERRWHDAYGDTSGDDVWAQIEAGAGSRLPYRVFQHGDERCNRTTYGFYVGARYFPVLDGGQPVDLRIRDAFFNHLGGGGLLRYAAGRSCRQAPAGCGAASLGVGLGSTVGRSDGQPGRSTPSPHLPDPAHDVRDALVHGCRGCEAGVGGHATRRGQHESSRRRDPGAPCRLHVCHG